MSKGAHDAIDVRIAINELKPSNIKPSRQWRLKYIHTQTSQQSKLWKKF